MLCEIATIGLLGCGWIIAGVIVGGVAVVASGVSAGFQIAGYYDQKDAAEDMYDLGLEAQGKAENREDFQQALQDRIQTKNQARLRSQMGSAIAIDHLRAKKSKYRTIKKEAEMSEGKSSSMTPRPNFGKPVMSGQVE